MGIKPFQPNKEQGIFIELLEAAPDATVIVDTLGIIQFINSQTEKLFGYKRNELLGKAVEVLIPSSLHHNHIKHRENYTKDPHARPMGAGLELEAVKKDGTKFPVEISLSPLQTDKVNLVSASIRDITERKKLETQLKEFNEDLEKKVEQRTAEHKKAEERLIISELRYRRLFETAKDGILILDADTGIIENANPFMKEMLGYTNTEFLGKQLWEIGFFKDIIANKASFLKLQQERYVRYENLPLEIKKGHPMWVEFVSNVYDVNGKQVVQCNIRDITERKIAEEKLVEYGHQLRLFVEYSPAALAMVDKDMKYIVVSKRWLLDYKLGNKDIIGKSHYEIFPEIQQHWKEIHQRCLAGAIEKKEEDLFIRADGSIDWVRWEIHPWHKTSGEVGGIILFTEVITERKLVEEKKLESESTYRDLVENISDLICTHDLDGIVLAVNTAAEKAMGYKFDPQKKLNIKDILSSETKSGFDSYIGDIQKNGYAKGMMKVQTISGEIRIWEYNNNLKIDGSMKPIVRGYAKDITEQKKSEQEILNTNDQLRKLTTYLQNVREEERKRIGREIHDELGQQLTAIKMDIAWIDKKTPDEANLVKQKLKNIITLLDGSNQSLRKILNELMPRILDENGLLEALQWQSRQFKENTGIAVEFITDETSITLAEDMATCIFRLYQESLTNVMRHAEAHEVLASLHIRDNNISFIIEDDGKGFETGTEQENRSFGILGMRERVLSFNGTFELVSAKGKGTKIMINLPYKKP